MKLGLDLHGVIDKDPEFFSQLTETMFDCGHEIYIVTGREISDDLIVELEQCGIKTHEKDLHIRYSILSITTYQKSIGTAIHYMDGKKTHPIMDPKIWNPTKAALCATAGIDIMIDDSIIYEPFFRDIKTQYIIYTDAVKSWLKSMFYWRDYYE